MLKYATYQDFKVFSNKKQCPLFFDITKFVTTTKIQRAIDHCGINYIIFNSIKSIFAYSNPNFIFAYSQTYPSKA